MDVKILLVSAAIALCGAQVARAGGAATEKTWSVGSLATDPATREAFEAMKKGHRLPSWVGRGGTGSAANVVSFGGHDVYVTSACKPHDCASERIAVLYDPQRKAMYGVLSVVSPKGDSERLTWLNIGGGEESIDGRTILYARLTGSLPNHPDAFDFR